MTTNNIHQIIDDFAISSPSASPEISTFENSWLNASTTDVPFIELFDLYFFLPIAVVGIPCNLIVVGLIVFVPSLRTTINQLKANLAVSDVIYLTINPLINALVINELSWLQCQVVSYLQYIAQQATCCLLIVMTIIRYDATIYPLTSEARWTGERRTIVIVIAWMGSIILMIPSVIFTECEEVATIGHLVTYSYVTTVIFVVPMFVHAYCHFRILLDVSRSHRERKKSEGSICTLRIQRHREKRSLTRQVVIIVLVFFICRAPLEIFLLWKVSITYKLGSEHAEGHSALIVHLTCKTLAYFTGVINPFLYAFCSPSFKSVFREMIPKIWRKNSASSTTHILPRWNNMSRRSSYSSSERHGRDRFQGDSTAVKSEPPNHGSQDD